MVIGQQLKPEQPARVGLLVSLFDDMGLDGYSLEAIVAAYYYFIRLITRDKEMSESNERSLTMGDINERAWVFLDAYDAGKAGNTKPEPS